MQQALTSISKAKTALEREEERINELLGDNDGHGYIGPRAPTLPPVTYSMQPNEFVPAALRYQGAKVTPASPDIFDIELDGHKERIHLTADGNDKVGRSFAPGSPAFSTLVQKTIATGLHAVLDVDTTSSNKAERAAQSWIQNFGGELEGLEVIGGRRWFGGSILVRARATVAHDSYERVIEVPCSPRRNLNPPDFHADTMKPLEHVIKSVRTAFGISSDQIVSTANQDPAISEFSRFYIERRAQEVASAGGDERKRKKLEDDFTPRLSFTTVGAEGALLRDVKLRAKYKLEGVGGYADELIIVPSSEKITSAPALENCEMTAKQVPASCLSECSVTHKKVIRHRLIRSDFSGRMALPEKMVLCEKSRKRAIEDEVEVSAVTGRQIARQLLKACPVTDKFAEQEHFGRCDFTGVEVLCSELHRSEISGKYYRSDEGVRSAASGLSGHRSEFVTCFETRQPITLSEAEHCAKTGRYVRLGLLHECEESGMRVLSSELGRSTVSGKRVLKTLLVTSSLSGAAMLESESVRATPGSYCLPSEARECPWSGIVSHPDDLRTCELTGLRLHFQFVDARQSRLEPLLQLLDGVKHDADAPELWERAEAKAAQIAGSGEWRVEAASLSPNRSRVAVIAKVQTWFGLRSHYAGFVFETSSGSILGRIASGKRGSSGWSAM